MRSSDVVRKLGEILLPISWPPTYQNLPEASHIEQSSPEAQHALVYWRDRLDLLRPSTKKCPEFHVSKDVLISNKIESPKPTRSLAKKSGHEHPRNPGKCGESKATNDPILMLALKLQHAIN